MRLKASASPLLDIAPIKSVTVPLLKWLQHLDLVFQLGFASGARAVGAAKNLSVRFDAVPDDPALAVGTKG